MNKLNIYADKSDIYADKLDDTYYKIDFSNKSFYFYTFDNCIISNTIKNNEIWEPHMHSIFDAFIDNNSIVMECGCHIGAHTIKMASLCDTLYGFESMPDSYELLNKNIKLNDIHNTKIYKKGVADKAGITKYEWIDPGNIGGSGLSNNPMGKPPWLKRTEKNIEVELMTIDSLELDKLDFMKIDVEGYEVLVIEGAMNTIKKCKPIIVMEVWSDHFSNVDINHTKKLFKNLLDVGYKIEHVFGPDFLFTPLNN